MFGSKKINTKNCLFILSPSAFLLYFLYCALLRMVSVNFTYLNYWSCANMNLVVVSQGRVLFEAKIIIKNYSGNQVLSAFLSNTVTSSFVLLT